MTALQYSKVTSLGLDTPTLLTLGVLDGLRREFPFFLLKISHRRGQLGDLGSHII